MAKGRARTVSCSMCGRNSPIDKAVKIRRSTFSYYDERAGIKHRGAIMYDYVCPKCARRRGMSDVRTKYRTSRKAKKRR